MNELSKKELREDVKFKLGNTEFRFFLHDDYKENFPSEFEITYQILVDHLFDKGTKEVILDIGTRDGDSIFPFVAALNDMNKEGEIIAFEPSEEFAWLQKNMDVNNIKNITLNNFAISDVDGEVEFVWDENSRNGGLKHKLSQIVKWNGKRYFQSVSFKNFDNALKEKVKKATFIKVDTEGSDFIVLNQLIDIVKENKPTLMIENWPFTQKHIINFALQFGYRVYNEKMQPNMTDTQNLFLVSI